MADHREIAFESAVEHSLTTSGGYEKGAGKTPDPAPPKHREQGQPERGHFLLCTHRLKERSGRMEVSFASRSSLCSIYIPFAISQIAGISCTRRWLE
jgi:hypothetical protein